MSKTKKLTNKEFKQILNDSGLNMGVWGYDGILNLAIRALFTSAREVESQGYKALAEEYRDWANKLFDELEKRGFYE